jgi:tetratricopeptide (TPR) repeat protein
LPRGLAPDDPDVGQRLNNLAELYRAQGRYTEAEPLYKRAIAVREKALGPDHPDVGTALGGLAALYYSQGRYAKAEPLYKRALAMFPSSPLRCRAAGFPQYGSKAGFSDETFPPRRAA